MLKTFVIRSQEQADRLAAFVGANWKACADQGKPLSVVASEYKSKRNLEQNAAYWRLLSAIADTAWIDGKQFSKEAWHIHFASKFIGYTEGPGGELVPMSTTGLSVHEFSEYMEKIQACAATELGLTI